MDRKGRPIVHCVFDDKYKDTEALAANDTGRILQERGVHYYKQNFATSGVVMLLFDGTRVSRAIRAHRAHQGLHSTGPFGFPSRALCRQYSYARVLGFDHSGERSEGCYSQKIRT